MYDAGREYLCGLASYHVTRGARFLVRFAARLAGIWNNYGGEPDELHQPDALHSGTALALGPEEMGRR
jgi:hypothetical protein